MDVFRQGVAAVRRGAYDTAIDFLEPLARSKPHFSASGVEMGSASYWLGVAYNRAGRSAEARNAWWTATRAAVRDGRIDVQAADAYVQSVFRDDVHAAFGNAAEVYVLLIAISGASMNDPARAAMVRHLAQLAPVLPPDIRERAFRAESRHGPELADGGGRVLAAWWRKQDSRPATAVNDRVVEHLQRVAHAQETFPSDQTPTGYDDRGEIYIRFGPPTKATSVDFYSREMMETIQALRASPGNNLIVSPSDFPDNHFWLYEQGGGTPFYFLFVDDGNLYRIGGVMDLIPRRLQGNLDGRSGRGGAKTDILLEALRTCYRQLATYHRDFGTRYIAVDNYVGTLEETRIEFEGDVGGEMIINSRRSDNSAMLSRTGSPNPSLREPPQFAREQVRQARREDDVNAYRQAERLPASTTQTVGAVPELPIAVRWARFLEADGSTRFEFYWGLVPSPGAGEERGRSSTDRFVIDFNVRRFDADYVEKAHERRRYVFSELWDGTSVVIPAEHVSIRTAKSSLNHFGLQWDQVPSRGEANRRSVSAPPVRMTVARVDSISALDPSPASVQISDLVPVLGTDVESLSAPPDTASHLRAQPFPFTRVGPETPLALQFEIYHLTFDEDDRSRYTVRYDLTRETRRAGLRGWFGGKDEETTGTETTYRGSRRRAEEIIFLDPGTWSDAETMTVRVEVIDEVSGRSVYRDISFDVADGP